MKFIFILTLLFALPSLAQINIPENFIGFNGGFIFNAKPIYKHPETVRLISDMKTKTIRFPGGTVGNCYHLFKKGTTEHAFGYGIRKGEGRCTMGSVGTIYLSDLTKKPRNILFEMSDHAKAVGAKIIYVANVVHGSYKEILAVLDHFKKENIEVIGIELGNELYFGQYRNTGECRDVQHYITKYARPFAQMIRNSSHRDIKISFVAPGKFDDPALGGVINWINEWNSSMAEEVNKFPSLYDAYSIHTYPAAGKECPSNDYKALAACAYSNISDLNIRMVSSMVDYFKEKFPKLESWITEWNMNISSNYGNISLSPLLNTVFQGCYQAEFLSGLIKSDWAQISSLHSYSSTGVNSLGAFIGLPNKTYSTLNGNQEVAATSSYYVNLFLDQVLRNQNEISQDNEIIISSPDYGKIRTVLTKDINGQKKKVFYVNCSGNEASLSLASGESISKFKGIKGKQMYYSLGGAGYAASNSSLEIGQKAELFDISPVNSNKIILPSYGFGFIEFN